MIDDGTVLAAPDLHTLAVAHFDRVLRAAPGDLDASPAAGAAAICRVRDLVWVAQGEAIEAYRAGQPLLVNRRLRLRSARTARPALLGPFPAADGATLLLATRPDWVRELFWARAGDRGIALEPAAEPGSAWPGNAVLTNPGQLVTPPLPDPTRGRVFYYNGFDRVFAATREGPCVPVPGAGRPLAVLRDGRLFVQRGEREYRGCRVVDGDGRGDIAATYLRPLRFLAEEADRTLLFAEPGALVWLREEAGAAYAVSREQPLATPLTILSQLCASPRERILLARADDGRSSLVVAPAVALDALAFGLREVHGRLGEPGQLPHGIRDAPRRLQQVALFARVGLEIERQRRRFRGRRPRPGSGFPGSA